MTWTGGLAPAANDAPLQPRTASAAHGLFERARAYVAKMPPAISGQGGHDATWNVARKCAADFGLSADQTLDILREYNQRCEPPWSDRELAHKANDAASKARVSNPVEDRERHWAMPTQHYSVDAPPDDDLEPPPGMFDDDEPKAKPETSPASPPLSPADIISQWRETGPLVRIPTGIAALDKLCRGGLPLPWRVIMVGAPSAGKTFKEITIADHMARAAGAAGVCVGILAVDEEPDDITIRLAQIAGFTVGDAELRDPATLADMGAALEGLPIRLYDLTYTIESAAQDLAEWAKSRGKRAALFIDSIQAVRSVAGAGASSPRESVEANVAAMRQASTGLGLLVVATSEANRASYRTDDAAQTSNDLAAGAESRAIEFGAKTQLMLRTPKDEPDIIHVHVAKNRRAYVGEFWLRLDRERHTLTECEDPNAGPEAKAEREREREALNHAAVARDASALAALLVRHPSGLGERELRATVKEAGLKWGVDRLNAARLRLRKGQGGVRLVETTEGRAHVSRLVPDTDSEVAP